MIRYIMMIARGAIDGQPRRRQPCARRGGFSRRDAPCIARIARKSLHVVTTELNLIKIRAQSLNAPRDWMNLKHDVAQPTCLTALTETAIACKDISIMISWIPDACAIHIS